MDLFVGSSGTLRKGVKSTSALRKQSRKRVKAAEAKRAADDPATLTRPLTPALLATELAAAERTKFAPAEADLQGQLRASDVQSGRIGDWYQNYRAQVDAAQARAQGAYAGAQGALQSFTDQGAAQAATERQRLAQDAQASAAIRGATVSPDIAARGAQAQDSRRQALEAGLGNLAAHGAADQSYLAQRGIGAAEQQIQAQQSEAGRKRTIEAGLGTLAREKGDFRTTYTATARQQERNNLIANATLGINQDKAAAASALAGASQAETKRHHKATESDAAKRARLAAGKYNSAAEKDAYQRAHGLGPYKSAKGSKGGGKSGGPTHAAKVGGQKDLNRAKAALATIPGGKKPYYVPTSGPQKDKHVPLTEQRFIADMTNKGLDASLAQAAWQLRMFGGVGANTKRILWKRYRIPLDTFPTRWGAGKGR